MSVTVDFVSNQTGDTLQTSFEVVPRVGELIYWPDGQVFRVTHVTHYPGNSDFQVQLHVDLVKD